MAKYMVHFRYTREGLQGLMSEGGSSRRDTTRKLVESLGGTMEAYYFAFGAEDGIVIADLPDNATAAAAALLPAATGAITATTTVLLTPEEVDAAVKKHGEYRKPGA